MTKESSTIPPDDPQRNLALARPNEDQNLPHVGLAGDTYTILLTGKDTAGAHAGGRLQRTGRPVRRDASLTYT